jgi:hypothetical protein
MIHNVIAIATTAVKNKNLSIAVQCMTVDVHIKVLLLIDELNVNLEVREMVESKYMLEAICSYLAES